MGHKKTTGTNLNDLLPSQNKTPLATNINNNLFNKLLSSDDYEHVVGTVGNADHTIYKNIPEKTQYRTDNQLIPIIKSTVGVETFLMDFQSFLTRLEASGVDISAYYNIGSTEVFNFAPPVDIDKLINYVDYYWVSDNFSVPPNYITIKNTKTLLESKYNELGKVAQGIFTEYKIDNTTINTINIKGNKLLNFSKNDVILLTDGKNYVLNVVESVILNSLLGYTELRLQDSISSTLTNVYNLSFNFTYSDVKNITVVGDYSNYLISDFVLSFKNVDGSFTYNTINYSTYDPLTNITTITVINDIINNSILHTNFSVSPSIISRKYELEYLLSPYKPRALTIPWNPLLVGELIWGSANTLLSAQNGNTVFGENNLYDSSVNFPSFGISLGDIVYITDGPNKGEYSIISLGTNYVGVYSDKLFFSDSTINYIIYRKQPFSDIESVIPPQSPIYNQLWVDKSGNSVKQWNGISWDIKLSDISMLLDFLNRRYLNNARIQTNPWAITNKWVHKSQLTDFTNVIKAQVPIIEYDDILELSDTSYAKLKWKYRSTNINSPEYSSIVKSPTLFELLDIRNDPNNDTKAFIIKDFTTIVFDRKIGNLTNDIIVGDVIILNNFTQNSGKYIVKSIIYAPYNSLYYQTQIELSTQLISTSDNPSNATISPEYTSIGDLWEAFDAHWLFNGIEDVYPSSIDPVQNPMIDIFNFNYNTNKIESNVYLYSQDYCFYADATTTGPLIIFDKSISDVVLYDDYQEGDLRVYIDDIRQYGNFSDIRSEILYDYVGAIQFDGNVIITPKSKIRVEVGEYNLDDIGKSAVRVKSNIDIIDPSLNITNNGYYLNNITTLRKLEQNKVKDNQYPDFKIYNIDGIPHQFASKILTFKENDNYPINSILLMRIDTGKSANNFTFNQHLSNNVSGEVYCYKNTIYQNIPLQTIWKRGTHNEYYIPSKSSTGSWDIPLQWTNNINHELRESFSLSQVFNHFSSIINNQQYPGTISTIASSNSFLNDNINYGIGGTIKEHNNNLDLLISSTFVNTVDVISLFNFAKEQYGASLSTIKEYFLDNIQKFITNTSFVTSGQMELALTESIINEYENNEKYDQWFGDTTAFNYTTKHGVANWMTTPAILGLSPLTLPHLLESLSIQQIRHHDGHISNAFIENAIKQILFNNLKVLRILDQSISSETDSFPVGQFSTGDILTRTIIGTNLWSIWRYSSLNQWEIISIDKMYANIMLSVETKLYNIANDIGLYPRYDFTKTMGYVNYSILTRQQFLMFATQNNIITPLKNIEYRQSDPFTWNYYNSTIISYPTIGFFHIREASYQSLYTKLFNTPYPNLEPWKLQEYKNKPIWWDMIYLNNDPSNTRIWNMFMWSNILNGIIPLNKNLPNGSSFLGTQSINQVKSYNYIPVNIANSITHDGYMPDALLPPYWNSDNGMLPTIRGIFDPSVGEHVISPESDYVFGDGNINEWKWTTSLSKSYDDLIIAYKLDPVKLISKIFGNGQTNLNCLLIDTDLKKMLSHTDIIFHGEYNNGSPYYVNGINQWYVNYNRAHGYDGVASQFTKLFTGWDSFLSYSFGSLIDKNNLYISNNYFDITNSDFNIVLKKDIGFKQSWMDALSISIINKPSKLIQDSTDTNWAFEVRNTSPISSLITYNGVTNFPFTSQTQSSIFKLNAYPIIKASVTSPISSISIDYNQQLSLSAQVEFTPNIAYTADISINSVIVPLTFISDGSSTIQDIIVYLNTATSIYGTWILINGNLTFQSTNITSNIIITDYGFFNSLNIFFAAVLPVTTTGYIFNKEFTVSGNISDILFSNMSFKIENSINYNGNYSVKSVYYDVILDITIINVNESVTVTDINFDGNILPYNNIQFPADWVTGTEIYMESSGLLPSPFNEHIPYYLIILTATTFSLATTKLNAEHGIAITPTNAGTGISFMGVIQNTFKALGGGTVNVSWKTYNIDDGNIIQQPQPMYISGMQNLINFVTGYAQYQYNNGYVTSGTLGNNIDVELGRNNNWQLELEKFIVNAFGLRNVYQEELISYHAIPDMTHDLFIFDGVVDVLSTGQRVSLSTINGAILPEPFIEHSHYYVVRTLNSTKFKLAISQTDALHGNNIKFFTPGNGKLLVTLEFSKPSKTFGMNPYNTELYVNSPTGVLSNVVSNIRVNNLLQPRIYDSSGDQLSIENVIAYRDGDENLIKLTGDAIQTNKTLKHPKDISSIHSFFDSYESTIYFNGYSVDGVLIYDSYFGASTPYFYMEFDRSDTITLRPTVNGHFMLDDIVYPNLETYTNDLRYLQDTYKFTENKEITRQFRKGLGYDGRPSYMKLVGANNKTSFIFWRGMIRNKGTNLSIDAYANQNYFTDVSIDECWAYKLSEFGDSKPISYPELQLYRSDSTKTALKLEFVEPGASPLNLSFIPISLDDTARWVNAPDVVDAMAPLDTFFINASIIKIIYNSENYITLVKGIYVMDIPQPADNVIITIVENGKTEQLLSGIDYNMFTNKIIHFLPTRNITSLTNVTVSLVTYDYNSSNPARLIDKTQNSSGVVIPIYNPILSQYDQKAYRIVDVKKALDPAKYNIYPDTTLSDIDSWGNENIDKVWFDSSKEFYLPYYNESVYPNIDDRISNWGVLAPYGDIKLFQWTKSILLPTEYDKSGMGISKKYTYKNIGTPTIPRWIREEDFIYEILSLYVNTNYQNPTTGIVNMYVNSVFDNTLDLDVYSIAEYVNGGGTIPTQKIIPNINDMITIEKVAHIPTKEEITKKLYKVDAPYTHLKEVDPIDGSINNIYYYWVTKREDTITSVNNYVTNLRIAEHELKANPNPFMIITGLDFSKTGYGVMFGINFDFSAMLLPVRYTQVVIKGLNGAITNDGSFILQFTRNFTLRDDLPSYNYNPFNYSSYYGRPTPLSQSTKHQQWKLFRKNQSQKIDIFLWNALTEAIVEHSIINGVVDLHTHIPSLPRIIYDNLYGTSTQYGLGNGRAFTDATTAKTTITSLLNNANISFKHVDIIRFNEHNNFDTIESSIILMNNIYNNFDAISVNAIYFECLHDRMNYNLTNDGFLKTSWVAADVYSSISPGINKSSTFIPYRHGVPCVTPLITQTISITATPLPSPSPTPSTTPTRYIAPTITPTPTISITPSTTPPITITPSITITPTPTNTPLPSSTPTPTIAVSPSNAPVPSITPSITPSVSITPSITPSSTINPSLTPVISPTPTASVTPTISLTPSLTPVPSLTPTTTITPSTSTTLITAHASPTTVYNSTGNVLTTGATIITATGGVAPYTYAWITTGGTAVNTSTVTVITTTSPTSATSTFQSSLTPTSINGGFTGSGICTVTDSIGQTTTVSVPVYFTAYTSLSLSASPTSAVGSIPATAITTNINTNSVTIIPVGGSGTGYTFAWTYVGGAGIFKPSIASNNSATTNWFAAVPYLTTYQNTWTCTVTDSAGRIATINVTAIVSNG